MKYCPSCGQKMEDNVFCLDDLSTQPGDSGPRAGVIAVQMHTGQEAIEAADPVFYSDENGVFLTPTMLVIPGKTPQQSPATYALSNISSVRSETDITARIIGVLGVVFGVGLVVAKDYINLSATAPIGTVLIVFGILMVIFFRPTYHLKITGIQGEAEVLKMSRKQELERILMAINEVINKRGSPQGRN